MNAWLLDSKLSTCSIRNNIIMVPFSITIIVKLIAVNSTIVFIKSHSTYNNFKLSGHKIRFKCSSNNDEVLLKYL